MSNPDKQVRVYLTNDQFHTVPESNFKFHPHGVAVVTDDLPPGFNTIFYPWHRIDEVLLYQSDEEVQKFQAIKP